MVINELLHCSSRWCEGLTVWVGLSSELHDQYDQYFEPLQDRVSLRFFETQFLEHDRYYVKLGLVDLVEQLSPQDQFLYIDYDHLVLGALDLDFNEQHTILVSSELKELEEGVSATISKSATLAAKVTRPHYNNSLIFSSVATMRRVAVAWEGMYRKLDYLPPEQREEIAFCTAAEAVGEQLIPAPSHVQEHFRDDCQASALFHYGGSSEQSLRLKKYLQERAEQFSWDRITCEDLRREHRLLQEKLVSLIPLRT